MNSLTVVEIEYISGGSSCCCLNKKREVVSEKINCFKRRKNVKNIAAMMKSSMYGCGLER